MWVFIPGGFVSIVAHRDEPGRVLVRARRREDLERFFAVTDAGFSAAVILETPRADYPFRVEADQHDVSQLLAVHAQAIDYDNFKAAPANADRRHMLHDVWHDVKQLELSIEINGHHVHP